MVIERRHKILMARFYRSAEGHEPVREWLRAFDREDRKKFGMIIQKLEFGWPVGLPHCRSMGRGLREIRVNLQGNRIGRILFFIREAEMILAHGFIKKSQQTSMNDIEIGFKRMRELSS